jgi:hypothetical protein
MLNYKPGHDNSHLFSSQAGGARPGDGVKMTGLGNSRVISAESMRVQEAAAVISQEFVGAWYPTAVDSTHIDLTPGTLSDGATTYTPTVDGIVVDATDLNYVYLECDLTPTVVDGITVGGTVDAVAVVAYTSVQTNTSSKGYILLCEWMAGELVSRYRYFSMEAEIWTSGFRTWTAA